MQGDLPRLWYLSKRFSAQNDWMRSTRFNINLLWNSNNPIITAPINILHPVHDCCDVPLSLAALGHSEEHTAYLESWFWLCSVSCPGCCAPRAHQLCHSLICLSLCCTPVSTRQVAALQHLGGFLSPFALISFDSNGPGYHRLAYRTISCFSGLRKGVKVLYNKPTMTTSTSGFTCLF